MSLGSANRVAVFSRTSVDIGVAVLPWTFPDLDSAVHMRIVASQKDERGFYCSSNPRVLWYDYFAVLGNESEDRGREVRGYHRMVFDGVNFVFLFFQGPDAHK